MTFRVARDAARKRLHETLQTPARCYAGEPDDGYVDVALRVHSRLVQAGDLPETGLPFSERTEVDPRLLFLVEDHRPERNNVYAVSATEAYQVVRVEPIDGITITAVCNRLSEAEAALWPSP